MFAANVPPVCTVPEENLCCCVLVDVLVQITRAGLISVKQSLMSPAQTLKCLFSTYGLLASIMLEHPNPEKILNLAIHTSSFQSFFMC